LCQNEAAGFALRIILIKVAANSADPGAGNYYNSITRDTDFQISIR
jgi:hypothetical protein